MEGERPLSPERGLSPSNLFLERFLNNKILQRLALGVPLGGVRIFRRVTDGEDVFRLCPFGDAELLAYGRGIEMHEPAAAQTQIGCLQKHVCRRYRRVGVGLALAVKGTHPDFGSDTADDERSRNTASNTKNIRK